MYLSVEDINNIEIIVLIQLEYVCSSYIYQEQSESTGDISVVHASCTSIEERFWCSLGPAKYHQGSS
jgi:hypothetical protein